MSLVIGLSQSMNNASPGEGCVVLTRRLTVNAIMYIAPLLLAPSLSS